MKFSAQSFANAAASTGAILWTACAVIAIILPGVYQGGAELLSFGDIGHFNLTLPSAILGGILFTGVSWFVGYVFGWNLEKYSK